MDITFEKVGYSYSAGTPFESRALYDVNLNIPDGSYTALIGHTGSGKSTVTQHLNALLKPTEGSVTIGDRVITNKSNNKNLKDLRKKVGIVFQFPESQLFEETIAKDIAFGPMNFGVSEADAMVIVRRVLPLVGLDETFMERSPFDLSGGQMRRVAIAGVLAMEPEVLVLDEPTAGLDPAGRREIMNMFYQLHLEKGLTIVLVTHQMNDVATYADHVVILEKGTVVKMGNPAEIFRDAEWLQEKQLGLPDALAFLDRLSKKTGVDFGGERPLRTEQLAAVLIAKINENKGNGNAVREEGGTDVG
ncbi:energy-coupling factor ABC transporter ATP-binding protein [Trichococcus ilyis]|jgi:energy-coupling factor transport system ATP-binding protein|uniref:Energy-coupling factor transporter ATP-binding protein EcfA2 n=1 Tax=Trichococcus ilyis TaxID=640938 RepID=A0A143YXW9_9LACT|nr:energy-coupling factor ABC transporter ATP-binding protein [Trichococcus ilyis]CZQ99918.1 abc transporter [Trichococcus ilyis]SEJ71998.1 energy-coupling factor transport system ATP-binding protein [Trichococcus ilyis]